MSTETDAVLPGDLTWGDATIPILIAVLAVLPFAAPYAALASNTLSFALLALSFIFLFGYMGYLTFGAAMFFAIGAYAMALLIIYLNVSILPGLVGSVLFAGLIAFPIGWACFRRGGVYFALLTLAFNQLVFTVIFQWKSVTGGDSGLPIPYRPDMDFGVFTVGLQNEVIYYFFSAIFFLIAFVITRRMVNSTFGSVLKAIRDSEERAEVIGYNIPAFKYSAFIYSAALGGLGGALFAAQQKFVGVEMANWTTAADAVVIALIGGAGSIYGALIGAVIFEVASDVISVYTARWKIFIGAIVILIVLFFRGGVWEMRNLLLDRLT